MTTLTHKGVSVKQDVILAGVGGQGILTIAQAISTAALKRGLHVKQAEVHGMAQRGGGVQSHLRISDQEIYSDLVPTGQLDLLISVEPLESLRYLHYLSDRAVFQRHERGVRRALLDESGGSFIVVDARLVAGLQLAASFDFPLRTRKLYRSDHLEPRHIDNLYSEQILMHLTGFTNVSLGVTRGLRQLSRRLAPGPRGGGGPRHREDDDRQLRAAFRTQRDHHRAGRHRALGQRGPVPA